jgi:IS1 family transposase
MDWETLYCPNRYCRYYGVPLSGDAWVWIAFAPLWRLIVAFVIGKRTQTEADLLLSRVKHVTTADIPFLESDQLPEYRTALLQSYG